MVWVGRVFPIKHFLTGMQVSFLGAPFHWTDVLVVAVVGACRAPLRASLLPLGTTNRLTRPSHRRPFAAEADTSQSPPLQQRTNLTSRPARYWFAILRLNARPVNLSWRNRGGNLASGTSRSRVWTRRQQLAGSECA